MSTSSPGPTFPPYVDPVGARAVGGQMRQAALNWLSGLDPEQRRMASGPAPASPGSPSASSGRDADGERRRWFYTPADHGGLALTAQCPAQQQRAMRVLASGLSAQAYVTATTVMGLENVLDQVEGWSRDWGWERGRDPGRYWLRVFGDPGSDDSWGWRFGGHHISVNWLVVDGAAVAATPCFLGADPACSDLLGGARLRPLGATEDLAGELIRSFDEQSRKAALLTPRAPTDIVGVNRPRIEEGDQHLPLATPDLWGGEFTDPRLRELLGQFSAGAEQAAGTTPDDHRALALSAVPKGVAAASFDQEQRELLRRLLDCYLGRLPTELRTRWAEDPHWLDGVHLAWAGSVDPGQPHYYRLQGERLLIEFDNTQRGANHAHSVWRDPAGDFGVDVLARHRAVHHP